MFFRRPIPKASLGLALLLMVLAGLTLSLLITSNNQKSLAEAPLAPLTLTLAFNGVTHNVEWQPVTRVVDHLLSMVLVPAGCFLMGSTPAQLEPAQESCARYYGSLAGCQANFSASEQPAHQVCFEKPFWIGANEITNQQYGSNSSSDMVSMYRGPEWPRDTVSWREAQAFCTAAGLRLPTEAEWEYAARGPDNLIYPWGNEFVATNVVSGVLNPMDVAQLPAGRSWVGAYDLSGSILEWVADWYAPYSDQAQVNPQGPEQGEQRVAKGGAWFSYAPFMVRAAGRYPQAPNYATSVTGFRCAANFD